MFMFLAVIVIVDKTNASNDLREGSYGNIFLGLKLKYSHYEVMNIIFYDFIS